MKRLLLMIVACIGTQTYAMENLPELQHGTIHLHNTLNESVKYLMIMTLRGKDKASGTTFSNNGPWKNAGTVPPYSACQLTSMMSTGGKGWWSAPIELRILTNNMQQPIVYSLVGNVLGIYRIHKNMGDKLFVTKEETEDGTSQVCSS